MRKIFKPELRRPAAQVAVDAIGASGAVVAMDRSGCLSVEVSDINDPALTAAIDRLGLKTIREHRS